MMEKTCRAFFLIGTTRYYCVLLDGGRDVGHDHHLALAWSNWRVDDTRKVAELRWTRVDPERPLR